MLRPATPLSILYLVAFVLLLLSTISTPIIPAIPLATHEGVSYGVFGACKGNDCTPVQIGYPQRPFGTDEESDFTLSPDSRHALSNILIVHPIAAFLTLVCTVLAFASHFHAPAHSPRYLLALLILSFPTLLVTLLAFLVDILLFVPHVQWGGWIVLAATLLIVASGIVTCAMRRTLVSRKARKKRIAENSEMNGDNYYANRDMPRLASDHVGLPRADSPPPMHDPKVPEFATFENPSEQRKTSDDDREPLNPRTPSVRSMSTNGTRRIPLAGGPDAPPMPGYETGTQPPMQMQNRDPQINQYSNPPPEQYGGPLPPNVVAMGAGLPPPGLRHHRSRGSMNSEGSNRSYHSNGSRGAPPGYRGRGGGPGPQRGGFPGPGPQRGGFAPGPRGGYGPPPRGGMNQGPYRGGPQGGPRGGPQGMRGGPAPRGGPQGMMMNRNPSNPAPPDYDIDNYYGSIPDAMPTAVAMGSAVPRTHSPAPQPQEPIGQAIEMDERNGIASPPLQSQNGFGHRDNDADVAGMVALQQARHSPGPGLSRPGHERSNTPSASSQYSNERKAEQLPTVYAPPRLNWNPSPSPLANPATHPAHRRSNSDHYYEDVDPRFASDEPLPTIAAAAPPSPVPSALRPGANLNRFNSPQHLHPHSHDFGPSSSEPPLPRAADSYENIPEGARSPAGSDASHFTSISQRGVNPNWRPMGGPMGPGPMHHGPMGPNGPGPMGPPRHQGPRRDEMILGANPDFALPGMQMSRPPRGRGGPMRGGMRGGPAMGPPMGVGPNGMGMEGSGGMSGNGRYPTDI